MASETIVLHGIPFSPNTRAARLAFAERNVPYEFHEVGFDTLATDAYAAIHPFRKVPALSLGELMLYETTSLMVFADGQGRGPSLQPAALFERARMWQMVGVAQNYLYPNAIMKFWFNRQLAPLLGLPPDVAAGDLGKETTRRHLGVVESSFGGTYLAGDGLTFADLYCGVMIEPLTLMREGRSLLADFPRTREWITRLADRASFALTMPEFLREAREA